MRGNKKEPSSAFRTTDFDANAYESSICVFVLSTRNASEKKTHDMFAFEMVQILSKCK